MRVARLGDFAELIRGITYKPADKLEGRVPGAIACMRTKNVQEDLDESDIVWVPSELVKSEKKELEPGDILVSSANSWNLLGKCCWVPSLDYEATAGGFISILRPTSAELDRRYLYHWFSAGETQHTLRSFGNKTTNISNLNHKRTLNLPLPLPPLAEQKRIAKILDAADALRAKRRETLTQLDTLLQSTFLEMFGDPVENPMGWDVYNVEDVCDLIVDCPHSTPAYSEKPTQFFCVRSSDVQAGRLEYSLMRYVTKQVYEERITRHRPQSGDIVYTREGGRLGHAAIVSGNEQICLGQRMMLMQTSARKMLNTVLWGILTSQQMYRTVVHMSGGGAAPRVNLKQVRKLPVICPPLDRQSNFASLVKKTWIRRSEIALNEKALSRLFFSIQQRAFAGEL